MDSFVRDEFEREAGIHCDDEQSGGEGGLIHSLQGTVHALESTSSAPVMNGPCLESLPQCWEAEASRIGQATVVGRVPFAHGVVLFLESPLNKKAMR